MFLRANFCVVSIQYSESKMSISFFFKLPDFEKNQLLSCRSECQASNESMWDILKKCQSSPAIRQVLYFIHEVENTYLSVLF